VKIISRDKDELNQLMFERILYFLSCVRTTQQKNMLENMKQTPMKIRAMKNISNAALAKGSILLIKSGKSLYRLLLDSIILSISKFASVKEETNVVSYIFIV
jgi:hypothetical protein